MRLSATIPRKSDWMPIWTTKNSDANRGNVNSNPARAIKAIMRVVRAALILASLVHLHLTFSGLVCILSLRGWQEQCPFTTRLRGLKLVSLEDVLPGQESSLRRSAEWNRWGRRPVQTVPPIQPAAHQVLPPPRFP